MVILRNASRVEAPVDRQASGLWSCLPCLRRSRPWGGPQRWGPWVEEGLREMSIGYWAVQAYPPVLATIQLCEDSAPGHSVASYGYWVTEDMHQPNRDRVTCSCGGVGEHQWGPHTRDARHARILAWRSVEHQAVTAAGSPSVPRSVPQHQ